MHRHHETTVERLGARKKSHRRKDWPSRGRHVAPARSAIRGPWSEQPGVGGTKGVRVRRAWSRILRLRKLKRTLRGTICPTGTIGCSSLRSID